MLKRFGMRPEPGVRVTLIARDLETPYSGMLPGYVAGLYGFAQCHIDLVRLARFAGARLIHDEAVGSTARRARFCAAIIRRSATMSSRSISAPCRDATTCPAPPSTPSRSSRSTVSPGAGRRCWHASRRQPRLRLAVVGGGAGGVELTLAAQRRLAGLLDTAPEVTLVTREGLLPSHNGGVRDLLARILEERGIRVLTDTPVAAVEPGRLIAAKWRRGRVRRGAVGYRGQRRALACRYRPAARRTRVRAGRGEPALAGGRFGVRRRRCRDNAGASARQGRRLCGARRTAARRQSAAGACRASVAPGRAAKTRAGADRHRRRAAVASRGRLAAYGRSLWLLKDWIDRRWMRKYTELPFMTEAEDAAGEGAMRCGGCAAKVPAEVLARAMARLAPASKPEVSLGLSSPDDAAIVSFPGAPPLLQTVDFFRAMVDDPYLFGRIAANDALGDIYAMGGLPETALAIATLPQSHPAIMEQDLFLMLKGGTEVLEEAGAALIGGHSAEGAELGLGFAVTGRTRPHREKEGRVLRKGGLRPGDRLVLTKPLGTGVILAAEMRGRAPARSLCGGARGDAAIRRGRVVVPRVVRRDRLHRRDRVRIARTSDRDADRLRHRRHGSIRRPSRHSTARGTCSPSV